MSEPKIPLSTVDESIALEKGRLLAAQNLARDPERRKMTEDMFGTEWCRRRWPEVYSPQPFEERLIDKIEFKEHR